MHGRARRDAVLSLRQGSDERGEEDKEEHRERKVKGNMVILFV